MESRDSISNLTRLPDLLTDLEKQIDATGPTSEFCKKLDGLWFSGKFSEDFKNSKDYQRYVKLQAKTITTLAMTRIQHSRRIFCAIQEGEFSAPKDQRHNLINLKRDFNSTDNYIKSDIISRNTLNEAVFAQKRWLSVLKICKEQNDIHSLMAIGAHAGGIISTKIQAYIPEDEKKVLTQIDPIITGSNQWRPLKNAMQYSPVHVPYVGLFEGDLDRLTGGNDDAEFVEMKKQIILRPLLDAQKINTTFLSDDEIKNNIWSSQEVLSTPSFNEDEAYETYLQLKNASNDDFNPKKDLSSDIRKQIKSEMEMNLKGLKSKMTQASEIAKANAIRALNDAESHLNLVKQQSTSPTTSKDIMSAEQQFTRCYYAHKVATGKLTSDEASKKADKKINEMVKAEEEIAKKEKRYDVVKDTDYSTVDQPISTATVMVQKEEKRSSLRESLVRGASFFLPKRSSGSRPSSGSLGEKHRSLSSFWNSTTIQSISESQLGKQEENDSDETNSITELPSDQSQDYNFPPTMNIQKNH